MKIGAEGTVASADLNKYLGVWKEKIQAQSDMTASSACAATCLLRKPSYALCVNTQGTGANGESSMLTLTKP